MTEPVPTTLKIIPASSLSGCVTIPGSKSQAIRALMAALLASGTSIISNLPKNEDLNAAIAVIQQLGAEVTEMDPNSVSIFSKGLPLSSPSKKLSIHTGNSGLTTRLLLPLLGLYTPRSTPIILDAGAQMRARPIAPLVEALRQLGMTIEYLEQEGSLPLAVSGNLLGGKVSIDGFSSQYLSALLFSLPCAPHPSWVKVKDLRERPYITMSLAWLHRLLDQPPQQSESKPHEETFFIPPHQQWHPHKTMIAADFSSAAPLIAAAALLPGKVVIDGLDFADPQADKELIPLLEKMGAQIQVDSSQKKLLIQGGAPLQGRTIDACNSPDLLPILAVIGTAAEGKTIIKNVAQARIKESDRITAMTENLRKMGAIVTENNEGMILQKSQLKGSLALQSYDDHRIAMATTVAGLIATTPSQIASAEALNKTFPQFLECCHSLGASLSLSI